MLLVGTPLYVGKGSAFTGNVIAKGGAMLIGVPKEVKTHEYRVGLTPGSVRDMVTHGHVVTVEDQGSGIAPDDVEQIFDIYVTKAAEEGHGVGLGLPLSRRLARLLGGELKAVSHPGRGGCLVLELPAGPAEWLTGNSQSVEFLTLDNG